MASLLELHTDTPLSWEELLRRNAEWHAGRDEYGQPVTETFVPVAICYACTFKHRIHRRCTGRAWARGIGPVDCACHQNGHAA